MSILYASPMSRLLLSLSLCRRDSSIDSFSCADSEGHQPRIIGAPILDSYWKDVRFESQLCYDFSRSPLSLRLCHNYFLSVPCHIALPVDVITVLSQKAL
jgi:hypothetical protein